MRASLLRAALQKNRAEGGKVRRRANVAFKNRSPSKANARPGSASRRKTSFHIARRQFIMRHTAARSMRGGWSMSGGWLHGAHQGRRPDHRVPGQEQVPYVFGICGHGNVGLLDALYEARDKIKLISPRHEQTAGHMADAYFRVSTAGGHVDFLRPGLLQPRDATGRRAVRFVRLLAITANVPTSQFNRSPFQELNRHTRPTFPTCCARWSSAASSRRASTCCRWRCARL